MRKKNKELMENYKDYCLHARTKERADYLTNGGFLVEKEWSSAGRESEKRGMQYDG